VEQFIETSLRSGYEDYYPKQVLQARILLYGVCQRVLDKDQLNNPPITEDPAHLSFIAVKLRQPPRPEHQGLFAAGTRATTDDKVMWQSGFWKPLAIWRWEQTSTCETLTISSIGAVGFSVGLS